MKIYSTRDFRKNLAECCEKAKTENVYFRREKDKLMQVIPVPDKDIDTIYTMYNYERRKNK